MKTRPWLLMAPSALLLAAGCGVNDERTVARSDRAPQATRAPEATRTSDSGMTGSMRVCQPANGQGTVSPAIAIYSMSLVVDGVERVLRDGDTLDAPIGAAIRVGEVVICTGAFSGNGGEACVDFAPIDRSGREILSEHMGTHMVPTTSGFITIPGPDHTWTRAEGWERISAVLNHWTPEDTRDSGCANRRCEHDDWATIILR